MILRPSKAVRYLALTAEWQPVVSTALIYHGSFSSTFSASWDTISIPATSECQNLAQTASASDFSLTLVLLPSVRVRAESLGGKGAWIPILEKLPNF